MKKMKYINIAKVLLLSCSLAILPACDDFLDEEPQSEVSPEKYLLNESQLEAYVNKYYADYDNWKSDSDDKGGMIPSFWGSENGSTYKDDNATDNQQGTNGRYLKDTWTVAQSGGKWNFTNINALNYYLQTVVPRLENGELTGTESNLKHLVGEGYFLRALEYFFRLQRLGDFPIVKTVLPDEQEALTEASKRSPRNEVARFILSDLDQAISLMNNNVKKTRLSKNAALLLKSRVALFEATWEKYHAGTALVPNGTGWPGAGKDYNAGYQFPSGSIEKEIEFFLTEAMSAALAGVDSMTVVPFDKTYSTPDEFSERLARNQQLLLKEESHFDKVIDPAAGSYYIENLTVSIAKQAWELFLTVEEAGGFYEALKEGTVQAAVNESNKARHKAVAQRREVLLGTNQFPNFNEKAGDKQPVEGKCCCGGDSHTCEKDVSTLVFDRAASEFEALRLETEASGKRPKAFMLTIGNLAMRQARAQYSCNFLACAGYEVIDNLGFPTVEEGVEAAMKAGADIVVICSSDDEYAEYAVPAFKALNGRAMFIVAGAPACMEDLKAAGIENFIHVRVNVLETLKEYNAKLGIK